jgi:hypothetical protein
MNSMKRAGFIVSAATLSIGATTLGDVTTDSNGEDLRAEIAALRAEVAQLRSGDDWLSEARADEMRMLVADVVADADTRASLQGSGSTAGWDNGFFLASADGNYRLNVGGVMQFRMVYSVMDDDPGIDNYKRAFENTRTKLDFSGHVIDPSWNYRVTMDFGDAEGSSGSATLQNAYFVKSWDNGWAIKGGQFKLPVLREESIESFHQLAVDRSLVNEAFNQDYSQGVALMYQGEAFGWGLAISDGAASRNTQAVATNPTDTEFSFSTRIDWLASGAWEQFADFTSMPGSEMGMLFGGAVHYQNGEYGDIRSPELEIWQWTLDAQMEFDGANIFVAFVGTHTEGDGISDTDQYGLVVQGGMFLSDITELFLRYEWGDDDSSADDLSIITFGFNNYYAKHNLKSSVDFGFGINEVTSVWASPDVGWRANAPGNDGQFVLRAQMQLLF